ncbi:G-protein alpha subunit-domain-containing protein [Infundibulicybe gibba]|nr:G-protein alpha subunit-domain-containing protein [Infundibulicybe gibba]
MDSYISACAATRRSAKAKARSDAIDMEIEEDNARYKHECKFSSWLQRIRKEHLFVRCTKIIRRDSFLPRQAGSLPSSSTHGKLVSNAPIIGFVSSPEGFSTIDSRSMLSPEIAECHPPSMETCCSKVVDEYSNDFYPMNSAGYFCGEALRISAPGYLSNEADVLRAPHKSQGMTETRFAMGQLSIRLVEVDNQCFGHKKWIHCFGSVTFIILCATLSNDQVLLEEQNWNKIPEVPPEASDSTNICLAFAAVEEMILQNVFKDSGVLYLIPSVTSRNMVIFVRAGLSYLPTRLRTPMPWRHAAAAVFNLGIVEPRK